MSKGFMGTGSAKVTRRSGSGLIVRSALFLSVLAAILISMIVLTVNSSNNLMNIDKNPVSNVPSNILPSYSVVLSRLIIRLRCPDGSLSAMIR